MMVATGDTSPRNTQAPPTLLGTLSNAALGPVKRCHEPTS